MNYPKVYDIENFDSYDNKYAILMKNIAIVRKLNFINEIIIKKIKTSYNEHYIYRNINDDYYVVIYLTKILIPIYGHFCNNKDMIICKKDSKDYNDSKFMLIKKRDVYCNKYNDPIFYNTLDICKKNINILKDDLLTMKYTGEYDLTKYSESPDYELIDIDNQEDGETINPGD